MNTDPVTVKEIKWTRIFPALHLFRAFGMAFRLRVLIPALLCVLLCEACMTQARYNGWEIDQWELNELRAPLRSAGSLNGPVAVNRIEFDRHTIPALLQLPRVLTTGSTILTEPTPEDSSWVIWLVLAFGFLAALCVGGLSVGHSAASQFCQSIRVGPVKGFRYAFTMLPQCAIAVGLAFVIAAIPFVFVSVTDWLLGVEGFMAQLARPLKWLAVFMQLPMMWGMLVAGCLATGAIATDRCNGAESLSRGINYVLSHFVRAVGYVLVVLFVSRLASLVAWFVFSYAADVMAIFKFRKYAPPEGRIAEFTDVLFCGIPDAVHLGAFFTGITLSYILLRQREDAVALDEMKALD